MTFRAFRAILNWLQLTRTMEQLHHYRNHQTAQMMITAKEVIRMHQGWQLREAVYKNIIRSQQIQIAAASQADANAPASSPSSSPASSPSQPPVPAG